MPKPPMRRSAGASLVQFCTALVFASPIGQIKSGLVSSVQRDDFGSIAEAVGTTQSAAPVRQPIKPTRAAIPQ